MLRTASEQTPANNEAHVYVRGLCRATWEGEELPRRIRVMPWGVTKTRVGTFVLDHEAVGEVLARNKAKRRDELAIDFEHDTETGKRTDPKPRAAFGVLEFVAPKAGEAPTDEHGAWLGSESRPLRYTKQGRELADSYNDVSPAFKFDKRTGRVVEITSAALCEHGEISGLTLFSAVDHAEFFLPLDTMDYKKLILTILALPATATDSDIEAKATAFAERHGSTDKNKEASPEGSAELSALRKEIEGIKKQAVTTEIRALLSAATRDGKKVSLSEAQCVAIGVEGVTALLSALPAGEVPTKAATDKDGTKPDEGKATLSAEDKDMMRDYGLNEEDYLAAQKQQLKALGK